MSELASQPTTVQSVYSMFRENKLFVNRRYQRKLVWTLEEKQRLIESIMKRYPIPAILIAERKTGDGYEIIDGLQRLHAIISFIETAFPTLDQKYFDVKHFPTAQAAADDESFSVAETNNWISPKDISAVLDYTLALSVMRNATDEEVNDVFGRINTYGHQLSDQERRQAGVENEFSQMIRLIACTVRGDVSADILELKQMPSISIDLPTVKHGYEIKAEEVMWVEQGVLRSTDLRDSMDEQCIADIAACIVGGELIERSKDALDAIYSSENSESERINSALEIYGEKNFTQEFKFCIEQILNICNADSKEKLRNFIFPKGTTNAFPAVFAILVIAIHELVVKEGMMISNFSEAKRSLTGLYNRIETGRKATSIVERRKNVNTIKGLLVHSCVKSNSIKEIYGDHSTVDIEAIIRRSEIELSDYELKQGILVLDKDRKKDPDIIDKVLKTFCAIANNGPNRTGRVILGVTDKDAHAARVKQLDNIEPKRIGKRYVVGIAREAKILQISTEGYYTIWKDAIKNSPISQELKDSLLSNIDYNSFYGLGVIVFTIPPQTDLSYFGDEVYWRKGDSTEIALAPKEIAGLAKRF
jgi:hypothetical protein